MSARARTHTNDRAVLARKKQTTGINAILYFSARAYQGLGISKEEAATTFVVANAAVLVVGTLPGIWLVEHAAVGRRRLLIGGGLAMAAAHAVVAACTTTNAPFVAPLAITTIGVFLFCFSATWGPVAWVVVSEVLPLRARARGAALATIANWVSNAAIAFLSPLVLDAAPLAAYVAFGALCVAGAIYTWVWVPETSGVGLEAIAALFGAPPPLAAASSGGGARESKRGGGLAMTAVPPAGATP